MGKFVKFVAAWAVALVGFVASAEGIILLPPGYFQLSSITSTGKQRIDTKVVPGPTVGVTMDFTTGPKSEMAFFGMSWGGSAYMLCEQSNSFKFFGGGTSIRAFEANTDYFLTVTPTSGGIGNVVLTKAGEAVGTPVSVSLAYNGSSTLNLFACTGGSKPASFTLRRFTMTKDGEAVRDFVPCCEEGEGGRAGLFDLISREFFPNIGSEEFVTGEEIHLRNKISVQGVPDEAGTVVPAYGKTDFTPDVEFTATAPQGPFLNAAGTARYVRQGWEAVCYDAENNETKRSGDAASAGFTYTPSANDIVLLTWKWSAEYKVSATATAGGSVSPAEQFVARGGDAEVTATVTDDDGCFYKWTGDVPERKRFDNPLSVTVMAPVAVTANFARAIHVATAQTGGSDNDGDGTQGKPYATIARALSVAGAGDRIIIGAGTYLQTAGLTLDNGVQLRGATGNPADVVIKASGGNDSRVVSVNDADSGVFDLTLDGDEAFSTANKYRTPLYIDANGGCADNCILKNGFVSAWDYVATGVYLGSEKAVVTRCLFTGCRSVSDRGRGIIYGKGKVSNCLVLDNRTQVADSPIVNMTGNGVLENCTIVENEAHGSTCMHLKTSSSAKVVNCVFARNTLNGEPAQVVSADATVFAGCASDTAALGEDGVVASAQELFKDFAHGNWEPRAGSPLVNGGVEPSVAVDYDLLGRPRVANGAIDVGAYELDTSVFDFSLAADRSEGTVPADFTFTASVTGCDAGDAMSYQWDFDGDGVTDKTTTAPACTQRYESAGYQSVTLTVVNETKQRSKTLTFANQLLLLPQQILVVAGNKTPAYPYATWETAAANIQSAIDAAVEGCEVVLSNGTYTVSYEKAPVMLEKPILVRGLTGNPEDVKINSGTENNKGYKIFFINNSRACLSGVALDGVIKPANNQHRTPVYFDVGGGMVTNCVIRNGFAQVYDYISSGVYFGSTAAVATHCVISNCYQVSERGRAVVYGNGLLSNCLLSDNRTDYAAGPIVSLTGSGRMENCTLVRNEAHVGTAFHISLAANAKAVNCVAIGNTMAGDTALLTSGAGTYSHCVGDAATLGEDGVVATAAEAFADPGHADYTPKAKGPLVDAGDADAVTVPSADLAGMRRVIGETIDIGAFELDTDKFSVGFAADRVQYPSPADIVFTSSLTGCDETDEILYCWDFDGDGETDVTVTEPVCTHTCDSIGSLTVGLTVSNLTKSVSDSVVIQGCLYLVPREIRVRAGNAGAAFPYDTWENAAADIQTAIDTAVDGCEVVVSNGIYGVNAATGPVTLEKRVTVRGLTGRPEDVVVTGVADQNGKQNVYNNFNLFFVNHAEATVESLSIDGGSVPDRNNRWRRPVFFDAAGGTVSNCVVRNGFAQYYDYLSSGIHLGSAAAVATHCVISNCHQVSERGRAVVYGSGRLSNSLLVGNRTDVIVSPVVSLSGSGRMENCTFVGNDAHVAGSRHLDLLGDACAANCVFGKNLLAGSESLVVSAAETAFSHCVADAAKLGTDGVVATVDAAFANFAFADYTPKAKGPLVDAGDADAVTAPSADLAGVRRVIGETIDIGAYELDTDKFSVSFSADHTKATLPATIVLSASVTGCDPDDAVSYTWDFDGDGIADLTTETPVCTNVYQTAGCFSVALWVENATKGLSTECVLEGYLTLMPRTLYVVDGNADAAWPYDTRETAAADVQTAVDAAVGGCEVVVCAGTYEVKSANAPLTIEKEVTVRGETGNPEDVVLKGAAGDASFTLVRLNSGAALLAGVAIDGNSNVSADNHHRMPVQFDTAGGCISNCVVRNGFVNNWTSVSAGIRCASDTAHISHCVISNCLLKTAQLTTSTGVYNSVFDGPGRYDNCLVTDNRCLQDQQHLIRLLGGSMTSCTVVTNVGSASAMHVFMTGGGYVRNSIFAANIVGDAPALQVSDAATRFAHCLSDVLQLGEDGLVASASDIFNDAHRPWHVKRGSPAHDVIPAAQAGELPSVDLGGRARLVGGKLDLGCYECQSRGLLLMVR